MPTNRRQVTVDQYFFTEVYYVVDTVVDQLVKDPKRHFIYVETGFFARWWDEQVRFCLGPSTLAQASAPVPIAAR